jgi:hypothetical protein
VFGNLTVNATLIKGPFMSDIDDALEVIRRGGGEGVDLHSYKSRALPAELSRLPLYFQRVEQLSDFDFALILLCTGASVGAIGAMTTTVTVRGQHLGHFSWLSKCERGSCLTVRPVQCRPRTRPLRYDESFPIGRWVY